MNCNFEHSVRALLLTGCLAHGTAANELPVTLPKLFSEDGTLTHEGMVFTTPAYEAEALRLLLQEANHVSALLRLAEHSPIKPEDLTEVHIVPFGLARAQQMLGSISTSSYSYAFSKGNRFTYLTHRNLETTVRDLQRKYASGSSLVETNRAYEVALGWLRGIGVDVARLNRELHLIIRLDDIYVSQRPGHIVPIYFVSWCTKRKPTRGVIEDHHQEWEPIASVHLCVPPKALLQLRLEDPAYVLRGPIVFTNLSELLTNSGVTK